MAKAIRLTYFIFIFILFSACEKKQTLFLKKSSESTGIDFSNQLDPDSNLNILNYLYYYNGAGVATADYNNDGLPDLYFTSNEASDKLYVNLGNFKFKDVTSQSNIENSTGWTTGVSNIDINNDGLMDLYISKVAGIEDLEGHNLLYINNGIDSDGNLKFKESSREYGLDFSGYSTQSVFLDYDLDGDLDLFLLNHSIHPNRNYGRGSKRSSFDAKAGDRIFRNDGSSFVDVSAETGIFQGPTGYGLGVAVGDLNNDGYSDIYVGNDFFENDYVYINQQDGTFQELMTGSPQNLGHTSHYSMGNDIADMNNDGLADIISLDMLPENLETYKTSGLEFPFQTYANYLRNGFAPQYMQNTLHINLGDLNFSEVANLSGVAATEWSWSALFADFDNDTNQDLFITNGIKGATNDMDYIKFISTEEIQQQLSSGEKIDLENLTKRLPEKKLENYIFRNDGTHSFTNASEAWLPAQESFSHGSVYVDLDDDGDLDLVTNNTDDAAFVYENTTAKNKFLKVQLQGPENNRFGIGAKVSVYTKYGMQMKEQYLSRGYLSSLAPGLHFGLGSSKMVDSVIVKWFDGSQTILKDLKADQKVVAKYSASEKFVTQTKDDQKAYDATDSILNYRHTEQPSLDFNRQPLALFAYSNPGPTMANGDLNGDGLEDLVLGGGKSQPLQIFFQDNAAFSKFETTAFEADAISENTGIALLDYDRDSDLDILVVSGGNEFKSGKAIQPKLYRNENGQFIKDERGFKGVSLNASGVSVKDFNKDGYPDVFISSNLKPHEFGSSTQQFLFINQKGRFANVTPKYFKELPGSVQTSEWIDFNRDGFPDLVLAGHWNAPEIYLNNGGKSFSKMNSNLSDFKGWWNDLKIADFDNDGDHDLVVANWGLNSRLTASRDEPVNLYLNDFDENGTSDPVLTYFHKGEETVFASKDELDQQLPYLKKKFTTYKDFAHAELSEIFPKEKLAEAQQQNVTELASCYFENLGNGKFKKHLLPFEAQVSPMMSIEVSDYNADGFQDILLAGNHYEISTQLGRLDASHAVLLLNDGSANFKVSKQFPAISGAARDIGKICVGNQEYVIITRNDDTPVILKSTIKNE
ncbi:VCBS repeat-containing protein [Christiangramia portivictoriae]|uniref:VCBS repeat-containing protein n=1 Tax=Christiangramia portivictoriae TaxID=326069 RepID=UPI0004045782|nr:VCBS repeat-containing protein [Christiangramia portivictoriae]